MSFILDALRKSEHERQRSALPGLAQVPQATPAAQLPRWALVVIGVLGATVLALGAAWWQSMRAPTDDTTVRVPPMVERSVALPPPVATPAPGLRSSPAPAPPLAPSAVTPPSQTALAAAATPSPEAADPTFSAPAFEAPRPRPDTAALPSAAVLSAQGFALPLLRLELHAFSEQPRDRFVFINGRKYVEGERLIEGPLLLSIEPRGAVLVQSGQRFLLVQE